MNRLILNTFVTASIFFITVSKADPINTIGNVITMALPVTTVAISLKKQDKVGLKQYLLSMGVSTAVAFGLKYTVNERRPNGGLHSFPSEHAVIAFSSAGFLWRRYGYVYGLPATLLASFVGYSRVEAHKHYVHDVLAGAAIGAISSLIFTKPLQITCSQHDIKIKYSHQFSE